MQEAAIARLLDRLHAGAPPEPVFEVPAALYTSPERFERERPLFASARILAASSEIAPGSWLPVDDRLLARDRDGTLRAFANACRHRASRLTDTPCAARAISCPYHGWTYDVTGALIHVPHAEAFGSAIEQRGLHALPVVERDGLVWSDEPALGEMAGDLAALDLVCATVWKRAHAIRACNWKLVAEAFLESYHVRTLHRDSVYRYFVDASSSLEAVGPHVRGVTERKQRGDEPAGLRGRVTPSLFLFPSTVVVEHPDFVSVIVLRALAADRTEYHHMMLVPTSRLGEAEHWDRNWELIEDGVFAGEDLWICEQIQRGLAAGTTEHLLFGSLEQGVRLFHAALESALR
jgi:phenylpropionate dioxygenase-like ring-hydroxylating dioxygenase large terminal subunit